jgi:hypothetical protein
VESIRPQKQGSWGECFELLTADCTACLTDLVLLTVSLRAGDHSPQYKAMFCQAEVKVRGHDNDF